MLDYDYYTTIEQLEFALKSNGREDLLNWFLKSTTWASLKVEKQAGTKGTGND